VIVHEDGLFGSGMARLLNAELPKRGFQVLETIAHPTPSRDMSNVALRIRALNPDLIIPSSYYAEFVLLSQTLQQRRIRPKGIYCILNGAASNFRFVREFPEAANLVMDCNHWADMRKPRTANVKAEVERAAGLTSDARDAYLGKLRATVRAYGHNVKRLGELAGIGVEVELPTLANDDALRARLVERARHTARIYQESPVAPGCSSAVAAAERPQQPPSPQRPPPLLHHPNCDFVEPSRQLRLAVPLGKAALHHKEHVVNQVFGINSRPA
jgi:hypothetical protein